MKLISIVTPCFNEEGNVRDVYLETRKAMEQLPGYDYEHIFIDNASTDRTLVILKELAGLDKHVKIIVNVRNFGGVKSPYHAMLQANGDAVILILADLQDPPAMIKDFVKKWEEGYKVVIGVKTKSEENPLMFMVRKLYYGIISKIAETEQIKNFTGFGLYDRRVIEILKQFNDPYPYFRGCITEIGYERAEIEYVQPRRKSGRSTSSLYVLYNTAMLGFVSYSMVPLRLAAFAGFLTSLVSLLAAFVFLVYKLLNWQDVNMGVAPLAIGIFFFSSVQLFFIGIVGEYVGATYLQVRKRPYVIERERINF